jgi:AcrR family transcriptional regulator
MFAERGVGSTSVRQITLRAEVNLASVHYHFGSKLDLLARRMEPVNAERIRRLDALERAGRPEVEQILAAFLEPSFGPESDGAPPTARIARLLGRMLSEPPEGVGPIAREQFAATTARFIDALSRALPQLPRSDLYLRFQFVLGVLVHVLVGYPAAPLLPEAEQVPRDGRSLVEHMIASLAPALRAPLPKAQREGTPSGTQRRGEARA